MLKNGLGTLFAGIINNATDLMTAADENPFKWQKADYVEFGVLD
jgi:hypothetical protein